MTGDNQRIEDLKIRMENNSKEAEDIYNEARELNMFNTQCFIDWQDRLNAVSYIKIEDLEKIQ